MPTRGQRRLARTQKINSLASEMSVKSHFTTENCKALLSMHERITALGKLDRLRFRELLHCCFGITDSIMLDLTFRAFDRNSDGVVDEAEFVNGLSLMLRGDLAELTEFCYFAYDMNGDRSLAREELYHCLRGCILPGFGIDVDEIDDAERDIVEIAMKKLDVDKDGQITYDDFINAVKIDQLMLQSIGPCLPAPENVAAFLSTITEDYRAHAGCWSESTGTIKGGRARLQSKQERGGGAPKAEKDANAPAGGGGGAGNNNQNTATGHTATQQQQPPAQGAAPPKRKSSAAVTAAKTQAAIKAAQSKKAP